MLNSIDLNGELSILCGWINTSTSDEAQNLSYNSGDHQKILNLQQKKTKLQVKSLGSESFFFLSEINNFVRKGCITFIKSDCKVFFIFTKM